MSNLELELKGLRSTTLTKKEYETGYNRTEKGVQVATTIPQAPENLIAATQGRLVTLQWDRQENLTVPHSYEVSHSLDEATWTTIGTTTSNTFTHLAPISNDPVTAYPIDTAQFYRVRIVLTTDGTLSLWSAIRSVICEPIKQLDMIGELADMVANGDAAYTISSALEDYALSKGVTLTEAFGNWEDLSNASVTVDEGGVGETTKTLSYIMKNVVIADLILGSLIQGSHIEAGTITADHISAGAITAEKIAAGAITADTLDINTILSKTFTMIDGGDPDDPPSGEEYDGGVELTASPARVFNDNTGEYTDVPLNNVSIESPLFMREGIMGPIRSINYLPNVSGWYISPNGDVEFNDGTFRGSLEAASGKIAAIEAEFASRETVSYPAGTSVNILSSYFDSLGLSIYEKTVGVEGYYGTDPIKAVGIDSQLDLIFYDTSSVVAKVDRVDDTAETLLITTVYGQVTINASVTVYNAELRGGARLSKDQIFKIDEGGSSNFLNPSEDNLGHLEFASAHSPLSTFQSEVQFRCFRFSDRDYGKSFTASVIRYLPYQVQVTCFGYLKKTDGTYFTVGSLYFASTVPDVVRIYNQQLSSYLTVSETTYDMQDVGIADFVLGIVGD